MDSSIQDYAKKINSKLTIFDCAAFGLILVFVGFCYFFIHYKNNQGIEKVSYIVSDEIKNMPDTQADIRPYASIYGKTYTFSWCQGGDRILTKNRIYFENEAEAGKRGYVLSKLCTK